MSEKVVGMCLGAADTWRWASADGENGLALGMEIVCNNSVCRGFVCSSVTEVVE